MAFGQHHNPPFVASAPTTTMAWVGRADEAHHPLDRDDAHHHHGPGAHRRGLRHPPAPHRRAAWTSCSAAATPDPVYPWFGKDIRDGIALAVENYALLHRLWREDVVDWEGRFRTPAAGLHLHAAAARRRAALRLARLHPQPADRRAGRLLRRRLLRQPHLLAARAHRAHGGALPGALRALRARPRGPGHRRPRRTGLHAPEQPGRRARVPTLLRQRPGLRPRPLARDVHGGDAPDGGQPGAGHRAHAGLPRLRGRLPAPAVPRRPRRPAAEDRPRAGRDAGRREVVPVLRREFAALKPAHVPDAPTHAAAGGRRHGCAEARTSRPRRPRSPRTPSPAPEPEDDAACRSADA